MGRQAREECADIVGVGVRRMMGRLLEGVKAVKLSVNYQLIDYQLINWCES